MKMLGRATKYAQVITGFVPTLENKKLPKIFYPFTPQAPCKSNDEI